MLVDDAADDESAKERRDLAIAAELGRQAIDDFAAKGDPFAVHHTVQITSLGGSGTTALTRSFVEAGLDLPPGPAQWPHKHVRHAPTADEVPPGFRVVYPVSDPRDAVLSIFRRGIQEGHWRFLQAADPDAPVSPRLADLETFLAGGVDEFALADHLEGWRNHPAGYPVMFVRFDLIDEAWDDLATFVGLPAGHPRLSYDARKTDWRTSPPAVRDRIDAIYGELAARIEALPPSQVI